MSGSMKDALEKSGTVAPEAPVAKHTKKSEPPREELPDDHRPYVPFEAPARTVAKPSKHSSPVKKR